MVASDLKVLSVLSTFLSQNKIMDVELENT